MHGTVSGRPKESKTEKRHGNYDIDMNIIPIRSASQMSLLPKHEGQAREDQREQQEIVEERRE